MTAEPVQTFDAIVVGARVAGSAAAIMLGRQGRKVLLLDKSAFPSDTISTHIVLGGGARVLERLGVTGELERRGAVRAGRLRMRLGEIEFTGRAETRALCLSRIRMDQAMVGFAREIGTVTVREQFRVSDLIVEHGAICGVRGADQSGEHEFRAPLTIGADGMRSAVAQIAGECIGAFARIDEPCARAYYYGYFSNVADRSLDDLTHLEIGPRPDLGYVAARCDEGRIVVGTAFDAAAMHDFRTDLAANFKAQIAENPQFAALLEGARLTGKVFSSGRLVNTYREPVCDGGLLIGDAGLHADPLFGQGHSFALMSAQIAGDLAPAWFSASNGSVVEAGALASFTQRRDALLKPYYDATVATSRTLAVDDLMTVACRAAAAEQWAADELARFTQMLCEPGSFPSFRFAKLMSRHTART